MRLTRARAGPPYWQGAQMPGPGGGLSSPVRPVLDVVLGFDCLAGMLNLERIFVLASLSARASVLLIQQKCCVCTCVRVPICSSLSSH